MCRRCTKHTPATRRIGMHHMLILTALLHGEPRGTFAITFAEVGPVVFCSALSARDHPRTRALLRECRRESAVARCPANPFDVLVAATSKDE